MKCSYKNLQDGINWDHFKVIKKTRKAYFFLLASFQNRKMYAYICNMYVCIDILRARVVSMAGLYIKNI